MRKLNALLLALFLPLMAMGATGGLVTTSQNYDGSLLESLSASSLQGNVSSNNLGGLLPALQNSNGGGLTNLNASKLVGDLPNSATNAQFTLTNDTRALTLTNNANQYGTNIPTLDGTNNFSGSNIFTLPVTVGGTVVDPFGNPFQVQGNNATGNFDVFSAASGTSGDAGVNIYSARGTVASPTAIQGGDRIGGMYLGGYGNYYSTTASIEARATQTYTGSAKGTSLSFLTCPNGSTSRKVGLTIGQDQSVSVPSITVTNAPTFQTTNATPAGVSITAGVVTITTNAVVWLTITNNGLVYSIQAIKN